jgi:hypothetical protein
VKKKSCEESDFLHLHLQIFPIDLDGMKVLCRKTAIL